MCILIPEDSTIGCAFLVLLNPNKKKKGTLQPQVIKVEKVSGTEEGQVKQESNEDKCNCPNPVSQKHFQKNRVSGHDELGGPFLLWVQKSLKPIKVRYLLGTLRCLFRNSHA